MICCLSVLFQILLFPTPSYISSERVLTCMCIYTQLAVLYAIDRSPICATSLQTRYLQNNVRGKKTIFRLHAPCEQSL